MKDEDRRGVDMMGEGTIGLPCSCLYLVSTLATPFHVTLLPHHATPVSHILHMLLNKFAQTHMSHRKGKNKSWGWDAGYSQVRNH